MEKLPGVAQNGAGKFFFRLIQTLPTFWAAWIWISIILMFYIFWDAKFLDFQFPRFPDSQTKAWARTWAGPGPEIAGAPSAAAPRQLRTTKLGRSKELGQYRENPISASSVGGNKSKS